MHRVEHVHHSGYNAVACCVHSRISPAGSPGIRDLRVRASFQPGLATPHAGKRAGYSGAVAFAGQEIHGQDGFRLRLIRTAAETDGELLEMEATFGGTERRYGPGETFEVAAGTPHQMTADAPSRTRWEVRPALRTAEFFERLYRAPSIADLLAEFRDEVRLTAAEEGTARV
jgi:hypothetical protein